MRPLNILSSLSLGVLFALSAMHSQAIVFIPPTSPDGPGTDVKSQLVALGIGSDPNADQIDSELFAPCPTGTPNQTILFQASGYSSVHRIGIYDPSNPAAINYLVGGASTGLPTSANFAPSGVFGLALDTPNGVFYSQTGLNGDGVQHSAAIRERDSHGTLVDCSYIIAWEDLRGGGDLDYNDIGVRVSGVMPAVPEPGSFALICGTGVAMIGLRRRRSQK